MSMLQTVLANLFAPTRSSTPDVRRPAPPALRGHLVHDVTLCTGCGTCAHVCAPKAITVAPIDDRAIGWDWYSGACSYCGLCEIWCPTHAIALEAAAPAATDHDAEMRLHDETALVACGRCGRPHVPMPQILQEEMLRGALEGTALAEKDLCEDCRRRTSGTRIRDAFMGVPRVLPATGVAAPHAEEVKP